jgi:hypothetical protein
VVLSILAISTYGPSSSVAESTNLFGMPASLRAAKALNPMPQLTSKSMLELKNTLAKLPGPSPFKELALAGMEDAARDSCGRDVSVNAHSRFQQVYMSTDIEGKAQVEAVRTAIIQKGQDIVAGQTSPMGYFDPLGFATKASKSKLLYYREAEIKHGRICMLASIGYIYGEIFHPFFGGQLDMESYKVALPQVYEQVGMGPFWAALFVACAIDEGIRSVPTLKGFGELKEDRVPGDFGYDPLKLKESGFTGTSFVDMQNKELNNGRLAMMAFVGMYGQELLTGKPILFNLIKTY